MWAIAIAKDAGACSLKCLESSSCISTVFCPLIAILRSFTTAEMIGSERCDSLTCSFAKVVVDLDGPFSLEPILEEGEVALPLLKMELDFRP